MLDSSSLSRILSEMSDDGEYRQFFGFAYRSVALRHIIGPQTPSPLYAAFPGSLGNGFLSPNRENRTLYIATEVETAHREGNQAFYGLLKVMGPSSTELFPSEESVLLGLRVSLMRLLDLRVPAIQTRLETSQEELAGPWKTVSDASTQRLGDAIAESKEFDGLIYTSVRHTGGTCLALFPDLLRSGSRIEFLSRTERVPSVLLAGDRK